MNPRTPAVLVTAIALSGCGSSAPPPGGHDTLATKPAGTVGPIDHPPVDQPEVIISAAAQRLSVSQLRLSLPILMGTDPNGLPITWLDGKKPGLDTNADTLGEADYIALTEEIKDPSPLYAKFMDDAARSVCDQVLASDAAISDADKRTLLRYVGPTDTVTTNPSGIDANLRYLELRMLGVKVADDDAETIAPLRGLFSTTVDGLVAGSTPIAEAIAGGWRVVCVALVTSPDFHLY